MPRGDEKHRWQNLIQIATAFARRRLRFTRDGAEDASQNALLAILRADQDGRAELDRPLKPYLHCILTRQALDDHRRQTVRQRRGEELGRSLRPSGSRTDPELMASGREAADLLQRMPEESRQAWLLHRLHDLSVVEIGVRLGVPERTIYRRLSAAEQWLDDHVRSSKRHSGFFPLAFTAGARNTATSAPALGFAAAVTINLLFTALLVCLLSGRCETFKESDQPDHYVERARKASKAQVAVADLVVVTEPPLTVLASPSRAEQAPVLTPERHPRRSSPEPTDHRIHDEARLEADSVAPAPSTRPSHKQQSDPTSSRPRVSFPPVLGFGDTTTVPSTDTHDAAGRDTERDEPSHAPEETSTRPTYTPMPTINHGHHGPLTHCTSEERSEIEDRIAVIEELWIDGTAFVDAEDFPQAFLTLSVAIEELDDVMDHCLCYDLCAEPRVHTDRAELLAQAGEIQLDQAARITRPQNDGPHQRGSNTVVSADDLLLEALTLFNRSLLILEALDDNSDERIPGIIRGIAMRVIEDSANLFTSTTTEAARSELIEQHDLRVALRGVGG